MQRDDIFLLSSWSAWRSRLGVWLKFGVCVLDLPKIILNACIFIVYLEPV